MLIFVFTPTPKICSIFGESNKITISPLKLDCSFQITAIRFLLIKSTTDIATTLFNAFAVISAVLTAPITAIGF